MKTILLSIALLMPFSGLMAQATDAKRELFLGKMTTGLSITLIILLALVIFFAYKNNKLASENMKLKSELDNQRG